MYRILIVEDEEIEREYLRRHIDWNSMDIEIAAALESGEEALEFADTVDIDVLLTDIKLIGMSGLKLAKKLLEKKPALKVIILSGYQEFEYAREAVEMQAFSFLTKPVDVEDLKAVLGKVVVRCTDEELDRLERERLNHLVEQNMPVLKNRFFDDLVSGRLSDAEIYKNLTYYGLDLLGDCFNVLVAEIDSFEDVVDGMEQREVHLHIIKVLECFGLADQKIRAVTFHLNGGKYSTILGFSGLKTEELNDASIGIAQRIQEKVNRQYGLNLTLGIGKGVTRISQLKLPFKQASDALAYKFYMGNNQIIHYNDVNYFKNSSRVDTDEACKSIVTAIELCDRERLDTGIDRLFNDIRSQACTDVYIRNICIHVISKISVILQDMNESFSGVFGSETLIWEKLLKLDTVFDLQMWLRNILNTVINYLLDKKSGCNKKIVKDMIAYIEKNYMENISVTDISREVYLSPNYTSILFKKEVGESFTNYLIEYRINKAVQLLKETNLKIYEIGNCVGYTNTSHFCSAFKKYYGVSPNEFRERL